MIRKCFVLFLILSIMACHPIRYSRVKVTNEYDETLRVCVDETGLSEIEDSKFKKVKNGETENFTFTNGQEGTYSVYYESFIDGYFSEYKSFYLYDGEVKEITIK